MHAPKPTGETQKLLDRITDLELQNRSHQNRIAVLESQHRVHHVHCQKCLTCAPQLEGSQWVWKHFCPEPRPPAKPPWRVKADELLKHLDANLNFWIEPSQLGTSCNLSDAISLKQTAADPPSVAPLPLYSSEPVNGLAAHSQAYQILEKSHRERADRAWATQYAGLLACAVEWGRNKSDFYEAVHKYMAKDCTELYMWECQRTARWIYWLMKDLEGVGWKDIIFMVFFIPGQCFLERKSGSDHS